MAQLIPPEQLLPNFNSDGSRRWVRPKTFRGRYYWRRFVTAWALVALFVVLPFVHVGGAPSILFDVPGRKFHLFGVTLLPTDGVLLMLFLLALFVALFLITAVWGRVWCGWACPQTVYLEFVFRPIEQWLEGSRGQQMKLDREGPNFRRLLKFAIYSVLSVIVANIFLAYFVGVERLSQWMTQSPTAHPAPFLVVAVVSALAFFDFAYFREQMCTVACPYARLQSVLLDKSSSIIGYDGERGEPRGAGKTDGGDCIDCKACVVACPTGIDIRDGLQLECIACAQCVDACDAVMTKIEKPLGLLRYGSQTWFETHDQPRTWRPRIIVYPAILLMLLAALLVVGRLHQRSEITVLRGIGAPYVEQGDLIRNQLRIKIRNREDSVTTFQLLLLDSGASRFIAPENPVTLAPGEQRSVGAFVLTPREAFVNGLRPIELKVEHGQNSDTVNYSLMGPIN